MAVNIGAIQGLIELKDDFTSQIGLAQAALSNFTKENQESLKAVAGAAGLVTAALGAATAAVIAMGVHGSDINDVRNTLIQFSGSAESADEIIRNLADGVKGTVSDFELAGNAAHLLSAGVKLTADDFKLLGDAAFVLADRGLGSTKENLDLVSDAMVTGKTRALSMALGVIDAGNAEDIYAKTLGVTADQLSETGKAEAHRIAVLDILDKAVKGAGASERDFGEQLAAARVGIQNWLDDLSSAIAASPVFEAGMKAIQTAVSDAFGTDNQDSIKTTVDFIEDAATTAVNFGLAMIEVARVINVAWSTVKTVILGVETILVGIGEALAGTAALINTAIASLPGATDAMKDTARQSRETAEFLHEMTNSLAAETAEAAKGITGHSEFDKTLDKLGGTLFNVKDAMDAANNSTKEGNEVTDIAAKNAATMAKLHAEVAANAINRQKVEDDLWKIEKKSLEETSALWEEYFKLRVEHGGTTLDAQKAQIDEWFNNEVAKLNASDKNWQFHYDALAAVAQEKLRGIAVDWDFIASHSVSALEQARDKAIATYDEMSRHSSNFTRGAMEEQLQKVRDTTAAAQGMGKEFVAAQESAAAAAKSHQAELDKIKEKADAAALAMRALGGSRTYDLSTAEGMAEFQRLNPMATFGKIPKDYFKTHTLADAIRDKLIDLYGGWNGARAAEGGTIMVGEKGPELVHLPIGSSIYPTGTGLNRISDAPVVINMSINYPIMNDARSMDRLGKIAGDSIVERMRNKGLNVTPQRR